MGRARRLDAAKSDGQLRKVGCRIDIEAELPADQTRAPSVFLRCIIIDPMVFRFFFFFLTANEIYGIRRAACTSGVSDMTKERITDSVDTRERKQRERERGRKGKKSNELKRVAEERQKRRFNGTRSRNKDDPRLEQIGKGPYSRG